MKDKFNNLYKRITVWLTKKPQTKATWIMVFVSFVMMWTLIQNQRVISQNGRTLEATIQSLELQKVATSNAISQLQIEQETRLNPELECAYNWAGKTFVFRNVGTMAAENIFLQTQVFSVHSNEVFRLSQTPGVSGTVIPPLEKQFLLPGETANANQVYVPNTQYVAEFWKKYGGEILVRIYVEYERIKPTYHRYSGYYDFTMNSTSESAIQNSSFYRKYLTEEEKPLLQTTLAQFNAVPRDQYRNIVYFSNTNMQEFPIGFGEDGIRSVIIGRTNGVVIGSWAKHH
jgi:hypothetical protein